MGCDIHFYVEVKSKSVLREKKLNNIFDEKENVKDEWVSADNWEDNPDYPKWSTRPKTINYTSRFYSGRDYFLFGVLGGVRYDCPNPIAAYRGLPDDVSQDVKEESDSWSGDGHSHSWVGLTELINADWKSYEGNEPRSLNRFRATIENLKKLSDNTDDVRCVFLV